MEEMLKSYGSYEGNPDINSSDIISIEKEPNPLNNKTTVLRMITRSTRIIGPKGYKRHRGYHTNCINWYYEEGLELLAEYDYLRIKKILNERKRLWFRQH